ncbi:hypothetical protein O3M35_002021 [Rhynocoris fuscipes]|uniref:Peptidase M14 domain-containing protein n=1 Tax=Rhynocoris fuscipes TaxID=488301 RepID=A0AAW1CPJ8_9HEMI
MFKQKNSTIIFNNIFQIIDYLQTLSNRRQCDITTVGKTEEGRPIIAVKIGSSNARTIVIESGVHAREWVTPMTALYVIERLLNNYEFVDGLQWIIIPLLNPDGYDYSWSPDFKNVRNIVLIFNFSRYGLDNPDFCLKYSAKVY